MEQKTKGHLFILLSVFIYGLYGMVVRYISDSFQPFTLSFVREGLAFAIMFFLTLLGISKWIKLEKRDRNLIVIMGAISVIGNFSMYNSYSLLQLGMSNFLIFASSAIFSWIIGILVLKEKVTNLKLVSLIIVLSGVLVMFNTNFNGFNPMGLFFGVLFGVCIAIYSSLASKISGKYGLLQVYMIVALIQSTLSFFIARITNEAFPTIAINSSWMWLFVFALMTILANGLYILGFQNKAEVSVSAIINPLQTIVTAITGYLFFQEGITVRTAIGGLLILIATTLPYFSEIFRGNKKVHKV